MTTRKKNTAKKSARKVNAKKLTVADTGAVPLAPVPFKETRAAFNAYLKSNGDVGGWKRSRRF